MHIKPSFLYRSMRYLLVLPILFMLLQPALSQASNVSLESASGAARPGLAPAVVYVGGDGHIHEIVLKGTWQDNDLSLASGAPLPYAGLSQPMAYRRSDGVSQVLYRGKDDRIYTIYLELQRQGHTIQEVWHWADLSKITGSPPAAADPYGYIRSDGINVVIYPGITGRIHELRLESAWIWADLTDLSGAPAAASGRLLGYARGDGINAIVYKAQSNGHIVELRLDKNGWEWADITQITSAPTPLSDLSAYVRSDGISTIIYAGYDGDIHDIRLENGWIWSDLTKISGAPGSSYRPFGYVRSDGINAIVYATSGLSSYLIYELRLENGWQYFELTSVPNAITGYHPVGYVRADGVNSVVYIGGYPWHIQELWLGATWNWANLSLIAGGLALDSYPWPYNRSVAASIYLPLVRR